MSANYQAAHLGAVGSMSGSRPGVHVKGWYVAIFLAFCASFLHNIAAVYATSISSSFTALNPVIKAPFYLLPMLVIATALYYGIPKFKAMPRVWLLLSIAFCVVIFTSSIIGMTKVGLGVSLPLYYIGDLLKFSSSWLSLLSISLLAYLLGTYVEEERIRNQLMFFCLFLYVFKAVAVIGLSAVLPYWQKIHIGTAFLLGYALFYPQISSRRRLFVLLLGAAAAVAAGKRGGLAIPAIAGGATILLVTPRAAVKAAFHRKVSKGFFTTTIAAIVLVIVAVIVANFADESTAQRFLNTYNSLMKFVTEFVSGSTITDQSMNSRFAENANVRTFYGHNPIEALFGAGFGAEIPMYNDTGVVSVRGNMHHVHAGWWVYFLRNGLMGVCLLFLYFASVIGVAVYAIKRRVWLGNLLLFMVLCDLAASYKSNVMLDSIEFVIPVLLGLVLAELARKNAQTVNSP